MRKLFFFSLLLVLTKIAIAQSSTDDRCSILKNGTFKYLDTEDTTAYFVISATNHTEHLMNGAYTITSKVTWIDSCSYQMLMLSNTFPDFPFKPGETMTVSIDKIEEGIIYYTSKVQGQQWRGRLIKIK